MTISTWYGDKTRHIRQRIIVEGDLVLQTPAHFGNGDGDEVTDTLNLCEIEEYSIGEE